jgi:hypothetical protein
MYDKQLFTIVLLSWHFPTSQTNPHGQKFISFHGTKKVFSQTSLLGTISAMKAQLFAKGLREKVKTVYTA